MSYSPSFQQRRGRSPPGAAREGRRGRVDVLTSTPSSESSSTRARLPSRTSDLRAASARSRGGMPPRSPDCAPRVLLAGLCLHVGAAMSDHMFDQRSTSASASSILGGEVAHECNPMRRGTPRGRSTDRSMDVRRLVIAAPKILAALHVRRNCRPRTAAETRVYVGRHRRAGLKVYAIWARHVLASRSTATILSRCAASGGGGRAGRNRVRRGSSRYTPVSAQVVSVLPLAAEPSHERGHCANTLGAAVRGSVAAKVVCFTVVAQVVEELMSRWGVATPVHRDWPSISSSAWSSRDAGLSKHSHPRAFRRRTRGRQRPHRERLFPGNGSCTPIFTARRSPSRCC